MEPTTNIWLLKNQNNHKPKNLRTMKNIIVLFLSLGLLAGCRIHVLPEDINPETNSTMKSTFLIIPDDYTTIQEAVNVVEDDNIIIIKEGMYPVCELLPFFGLSKTEFLSRLNYYYNRYFIIKNEDQNKEYANVVVKDD